MTTPIIVTSNAYGTFANVGRNSDDPSTFVLVKENRMEPGEYGVWSDLTVPELEGVPAFDKHGPLGFATVFEPGSKERPGAFQFDARQEVIPVAAIVGGVPHTFAAGRELLAIAPPTYVLEPTSDGSIGRSL